MKTKKILGLTTAIIISFSIFSGCTNKSEDVKEESATKVVATIKGDVTIPTSPKRIVDIS